MDKPNYVLSEIDHLFYDLFKRYPPKEGQSYELIVGAALKILNPNDKIMWNKKMRGKYDQNLYQIDVSLFSVETNSIVAVETKDHTKFRSKVNRPELDKLAGSLIEIDSHSGYFFSATGYTKDAEKKSMGSKLNPSSKEILLYHLRPSLKSDDEGRLKALQLNVNFVQPDFKNGSFTPIISGKFFDDLLKLGHDVANKTLKANLNNEGSTIHMNAIFSDQDNLEIGYLRLSATLSGSIFTDAVKNNLLLTEGTCKVDSGTIEMYGVTGSIDGLNYKIPILVSNELQHEVRSVGVPKLFVKSNDDSINTLITDYQLKGIAFKDDGEVLFDGRHA